MPTEVRRITFKTGELAEALGTASELSATETAAAALSFVQGAGGTAALKLTAGEESAGGRTIEIAIDEVGSALVKYCLDHGIPIPQQASRSLSINDGKLALYIHMDEEVEASNVALPDFYDYDFYG